MNSNDHVYERRQYIGLFLGPGLCVLMMALGAPAGMKAAAWHTAAVAVWMATWWVTEALPIPVTSLLPLIMFPLLGIGQEQVAAKKFNELVAVAAAPYADPVVFMFMGGFIIALAMERWNLHKRIALNIIRVVGTSPVRLIYGFMIATAFISMWINNTAATMMMLPIALSVVRLLYAEHHDEGGRNFVVVLMLAIAHASTIGGLGTLIGTAPNMFFAGFMRKTYNIQISFAQWMMAATPMVMIAIPLVTLILTKWVFPIRIRAIDGADELVKRELTMLGNWTNPEIKVGIVFLVTASLWIFRSIAEPAFGIKTPFLSDAGISMAGALLLFVWPVNLKRGDFVMDWHTAAKLPWGLILLFGGGLSLAEAIKNSGLADWIGHNLTAIGGWPPLLMILVIVVLTIFLTEFTSNTALTATLLPILAPIALNIGQNPLLLLIPATIAASTGFMMPVGTPPNAIVYGTGYLTVKDMIRAGIWLNLFFAVLVTLATYSLFVWVFGIEFGIVPSWAK